MKRFKNILCVIDKKDSTQNILERAVKLAKDNQAKLTLASVIENSKTSFNIFEKLLNVNVKTLLEKERRKELEELTEAYVNQLEIEIKIFFGTPFYKTTMICL